MLSAMMPAPYLMCLAVPEMNLPLELMILANQATSRPVFHEAECLYFAMSNQAQRSPVF